MMLVLRLVHHAHVAVNLLQSVYLQVVEVPVQEAVKKS